MGTDLRSEAAEGKGYGNAELRQDARTISMPTRRVHSPLFHENHSFEGHERRRQQQYDCDAAPERNLDPVFGVSFHDVDSLKVSSTRHGLSRAQFQPTSSSKPATSLSAISQLPKPCSAWYERAHRCGGRNLSRRGTRCPSEDGTETSMIAGFQRASELSRTSAGLLFHLFARQPKSLLER